MSVVAAKTYVVAVMAPGWAAMDMLARSTSAGGGVPQVGVAAAVVGTTAATGAEGACTAALWDGDPLRARPGAVELQAASPPTAATSASILPVFPCV
ncbi:hypothetical protein GCM10009817_02770 [Terrabacter lapilli]|uniref:Secreted protein n=1 Tax=Terrabacter lapilli TaxID=436231 RepID=A0ABN2RAZ1_9MICO